MKQSILRLVLPLLAVFALASCAGDSLFPTAPAASGTTMTGGVVAQVTNAGSPAGGIEVVLNQNVVQVTNALGQAHFADLPPGPYTITVLVPPGFLLDPGLLAVQNVTVTTGGTASVFWSIRPTENVGGIPGP